MHTTSFGVNVEHLRGQEGPIRARATEIEHLAIQMSDSAIRIRQIANGDAKGVGYSMDHIRLQGDELAEKLDQAAERYSRGGQVYQAYAVSTYMGLKPQVDVQVGVVDNAYVLYEEAQRLADLAVGQPQHPALAAAALAAWENYLLQKDVVYQNMYQAWRDVVARDSGRLSDACDILKDSLLMQLSGAIDWVVKGAGVVAFAAGLASLLFPPAGLIALAAGAVALGGTALLASEGMRTGGDVAWAALGVLPLARIARVATSAVKGAAQATPLAKLELMLATKMPLGPVDQAAALVNRIAKPLTQGGRAGAWQAVNEGVWQVTKPVGQVAAVSAARRGSDMFPAMVAAGQNAGAVNTLRSGLANVTFRHADSLKAPLGGTVEHAAKNMNGALAHSVETVNTVLHRSIFGTGKGADDLFKGAFADATRGMTAEAGERFKAEFFQQLGNTHGGMGVVSKSLQNWLDQPYGMGAVGKGTEYTMNALFSAERGMKVLSYLESAGFGVTPGFDPSTLNKQDIVGALTEYLK